MPRRAANDRITRAAGLTLGYWGCRAVWVPRRHTALPGLSRAVTLARPPLSGQQSLRRNAERRTTAPLAAGRRLDRFELGGRHCLHRRVRHREAHSGLGSASHVQLAERVREPVLDPLLTDG